MPGPPHPGRVSPYYHGIADLTPKHVPRSAPARRRTVNGWSGRRRPCHRRPRTRRWFGNRRPWPVGRFSNRWIWSVGWPPFRRAWAIGPVYINIHIDVMVVIIPQHRIVERVITIPNPDRDAVAGRQCQACSPKTKCQDRAFEISAGHVRSPHCKVRNDAKTAFRSST